MKKFEAVVTLWSKRLYDGEVWTHPNVAETSLRKCIRNISPIRLANVQAKDSSDVLQNIP
jgi:hypothetical protein